MHFTEEQTALLKTWVIKKLEDISDADADVLADYAIALVSTEDSEEVARANCVENLKDFLPENAEQFVGDFFDAIETKSYDPSQPKPRPAPAVSQAPSGPKNNALGPMNESRKRSFQWDREDTSGQSGMFNGGNRPTKQVRRGGRGGGLERGGRPQQANLPPFAPQQFAQFNLPPPPQGFPPLDFNDPMVMAVMQQWLATGMSPQNGMPVRPPGSGQRCRDYDTKGFCAAGSLCPYDHGNDRFVIPLQNQEYDPSAATLNLTPDGNGNTTFSDRGRGGQRGRGRGTHQMRGGGRRSDFSMLGPNRDSTNTSIVVEQIPEDRLDEQSVRDFFSDFGSIEEVTMHHDRQLAVVKYENKSSAKAAYDSPKVVFDNRFVKVYWYNSERFEQQHSGHPSFKPIKSLDVEMQDQEPQIDQAELAKRQEEAQRKHDDARKQREATAKQRASLDEKLRAMETERTKMADLLAKKSGKAPSPTTETSTQNGNDDSEQTKDLRAQLAKLEAEAKALGIDPDAPLTNGYDNFSSPPFRGRGGYRGRGRGRGFYQPYRGDWAGGALRGAPRGGAVKRLDNRPKTISVTFANGNSYDANDEALRQFLLFNNMDTGSVTKHPEKDDTALIAFHQRYEGENFMLAARSQILQIGKVETAWHSGPPGVKVDVGTNGTNGTHGDEYADVKIEGVSEIGDQDMYDHGEGEEQEQDLDRFA